VNMYIAGKCGLCRLNFHCGVATQTSESDILWPQLWLQIAILKP